MIRKRSYWNFSNLKPRDPVILALCTQEAFQKSLEKAKRRIEREKKQSYIRHKLTEKLGNMTDLATLQDHDSGISLEAVQVYMNENSTIVADFEEKMQNRRLKNKSKSSLEKFMETE